MTAQTEVTQLVAPQIEEAGEVLGRAFFDDPATIYVLPDEAKRADPLTWFMTGTTRYGHLYGEVNTTAAKVEGAAIWLPPEQWEMTPEGTEQAGLGELESIVGPDAYERFTNVFGHLGELHERDVQPRHWYLFFLGVAPPRQGQGVGSALIQPVLARADSEGLPCYLETFKARNVPFYQRHGFQVVLEDDVPGGPHFWTMKREARR